MKKVFALFIVVIMLQLVSSCENNDEPSKSPKFELINELAGKSVFAVQFNTIDELLIGTPDMGIFLYNEVKKELKEVITSVHMWNLQNHKISIGKSIFVHYHVDYPQTLKSTDDGHTWSSFLIDGDKVNDYMPIVSGNHFFVINQVMSKIYVLDSDFNFLEPFDIQSGNENSIYPWFDGKILLKEQNKGADKWFVMDYMNKSKTQIEFNQPGDYQSFLIQDNLIWAFETQEDKVFQSADSGKSFTEVPNLPATTINDVKILNNMLYIASDKGVFRTSNKGQSWETIYTSAEEPVCIAMNSKNKLYIVTVQTKVYREK